MSASLVVIVGGYVALTASFGWKGLAVSVAHIVLMVAVCRWKG